MLLILAALIATPAQAVRNVVIPPAAVSKPVHIDCPIGQLTQIVFPERLILLKASAGAADDLGVAAERSSPLGVVGVRPVKATTGTLELRGPSLLLTVVVRGVEKGAGSEIRLTLGTSPPKPAVTSSPAAMASMARPGSLPSPTPASRPPPSTQPAVSMAATPTVEPSTALASTVEPQAAPSSRPVSALPDRALRAGGFDADALKAAKPITIGRREGLPGEPEMVLDAALSGENAVWLRFYLRRAPAARVERITWEGGEVRDFVQETVGKDLRIVAQLPKEKVNSKTRLTVKIASGGTYRFALNTGTFTDFLKGLFR